MRIQSLSTCSLACLLLWQAELAGPHECPLELWSGTVAWLERKIGGEDLHDPLEMGAERKGRPQQVVYYRAGGELGPLDLEESREKGRSSERRRSAARLPASLPSVASEVPIHVSCRIYLVRIYSFSFYWSENVFLSSSFHFIYFLFFPGLSINILISLLCFYDDK